MYYDQELKKAVVLGDGGFSEDVTVSIWDFKLNKFKYNFSYGKIPVKLWYYAKKEEKQRIKFKWDVKKSINREYMVISCHPKTCIIINIINRNVLNFKNKNFTINTYPIWWTSDIISVYQDNEYLVYYKIENNNLIEINKEAFKLKDVIFIQYKKGCICLFPNQTKEEIDLHWHIYHVGMLAKRTNIEYLEILLRNRQFVKAVEFAKERALDLDMIYKRSWLNMVDKDGEYQLEYLNQIKDIKWVIGQSISSFLFNIEDEKDLLKFGLLKTKKLLK